MPSSCTALALYITTMDRLERWVFLIDWITRGQRHALPYLFTLTLYLNVSRAIERFQFPGY
jgi:hypothetical protein